MNRASCEDGGRDGQTSNPVFTTVTIRRTEGRKAIEEREASVDRTRTGTESISSGPVRFVLQVCGPLVVSDRPALRPSRGHNELGHWGVGRRTIKTLTHFRSFGRRIVRSCISTRLHESSGKLIPRPLSSRQRGAAEPNRMGSFNAEKKLHALIVILSPGG